MLDLGTPVCILSPLTPEECTRRLRSIAASKREVPATQADFVIRGKVSGNYCSFTPVKVFWSRGDPDYRNLSLNIISAPGGTILQGGLATSLLTLLINTIVLAFLFGLAAQALSRQDRASLWMPLLMAFFYLLLLIVNLVRRRKPEARLLEFIRSTVQGVLQEPASRPHP